VLAGACAHSLTRNHPFLDGNKRVAFVVTRARADAMWAVMTWEGKEGRWRTDEFFGTGEGEMQGYRAGLVAAGLPARYRRALDFGCGVGWGLGRARLRQPPLLGKEADRARALGELAAPRGPALAPTRVLLDPLDLAAASRRRALSARRLRSRIGRHSRSSLIGGGRRPGSSRSSRFVNAVRPSGWCWRSAAGPRTGAPCGRAGARGAASSLAAGRRGPARARSRCGSGRLPRGPSRLPAQVEQPALELHRAVVLGTREADRDAAVVPWVLQRGRRRRVRQEDLPKGTRCPLRPPSRGARRRARGPR
jgi:hypothetical protein